MKFIYKSIVLSLCGGISFAFMSLALSFGMLIINYERPYGNMQYEYKFLPMFEGTIFLFLSGFLISFVFGSPCLFIVEKFFKRFKYRYVVCGFLLGYFLWTLLNTFPQKTHGVWVNGLCVFMVLIGGGAGFSYSLIIKKIEGMFFKDIRSSEQSIEN
jgi:hypothetical protein